ncbi:MAG: hypothetical protein LBG57_09685 [Treponema sp.]|jgi:hypothetical protein|nr:hypothetical protein [Treponema sp.]
MKNKLSDLNDHLFEAIEWLGDRDLKGEDLREEIRRAEAKCRVAQQIIANGNLILNAVRTADNFMDKKTKLPPLLVE